MARNTLSDTWKHSLYLTSLTDWFLGFFGRAAQLILIITTVYQGAGLLPGVSLPATLSSAVFIVQMLTLDIGGMGLGRIAKQARAEGDSEGAHKTAALGKWLIRIVIATLVAAALEQIIKPLPVYQDIKPGVDVVFLVIGSCLTIARAVCAVQYSVVMHSLKSHASHHAPQAPSDVQALVSWSMVGMAAHLQQEYQHQLSQVANEQAHVLATVQRVQNSVPTIDQTAIVNAVIEHFAEQFEQGMKRLAEQHVQVFSEHHTPALPEHSHSRPNTERHPKQSQQQDRKIVRLDALNRGMESHQDAINRLLDEDMSRGPRELARLAGCSPATAKNYRDLYLNAWSERNGTEH